MDNPKPMIALVMSVDEYLDSLIFTPEYEDYIRGNQSKYGVKMVKGTDDYCFFPGGYYKASISRLSNGLWRVFISNLDDGFAEKDHNTRAEAETSFAELNTLAPFALWELESFGYCL